jgi:hypothetical protein
MIPGANPMLSEQQLVSQWRQLPSERQQEVIDFVAFLAQRDERLQPSPPANPSPRYQFQQLRDNIIAAGIPLLSDTEIEQEIADRPTGPLILRR